MTNTVGDITEAVTCTRNGVMMLGEPTYGANEGRRKGGIHSEYQSKPVGSSDVAPDIQWNAGLNKYDTLGILSGEMLQWRDTDQGLRSPSSPQSYLRAPKITWTSRSPSRPPELSKGSGDDLETSGAI
uniref:Uncharacterized protein n=2 Tax=Oryza sativa subsp. japonica TaxID=39947 RepID=Q2QZB1_ORYSJ|nr:hypothetical protein LOC_Os11g47100 [Oryza sativa Japonica Group]ABA95453.1 hypothetical protein LOC_Os11g47100 [Oryza sativa Japonica Group]